MTPEMIWTAAALAALACINAVTAYFAMLNSKTSQTINRAVNHHTGDGTVMTIYQLASQQQSRMSDMAEDQQRRMDRIDEKIDRLEAAFVAHDNWEQSRTGKYANDVGETPTDSD